LYAHKNLCRIDKTPLIIAQLKSARLEYNYWSEYNSIQSQLELHKNAEANDRAMFEKAFYVLSAKMRELLKLSSRADGASLT